MDVRHPLWNLRGLFPIAFLGGHEKRKAMAREKDS